MDKSLHEKLQQIGDLELAVLVSLIAEEHCLFSGPEYSARDLRNALQQVCASVFGLRVAMIECTPYTTVDVFSEAILLDATGYFDDEFETRDDKDQNQASPPNVDAPASRHRSHARFGSLSNSLDDRRIADVVIATHLDRASAHVQIQALELLRTKRVFTRAAMHSAPKDFLFLAVLSHPEARLSHHLNDMFAMSHAHDEGDDLPHHEAAPGQPTTPMFKSEEIKALRAQAGKVVWDAEVAQYLHQIVVFARMNRFIRGGVTAISTRNLRSLAQALAPLHGLDFVPPSLVTLAARKVYAHRLILATAQTERSLQWGSDPLAIQQLLEGVTVQDAIENVLASVETPL
nr:hypothetical protein CFP56_02923 [Quercus suber]